MSTQDNAILIIDDDELNCEILSNLLEEKEFQHDVVNDGASALKILQSNPEKYQLLLILAITLFAQWYRSNWFFLGVTFTVFTYLMALTARQAYFHALIFWGISPNSVMFIQLKSIQLSLGRDWLYSSEASITWALI